MSDVRERQFDFGPQRGSWLTRVTTAVLVAAAKRQLKTHRDRLRYWEKEATDASTALKKSMKMHEQPVTGGVQRVAVYDQAASQRVTTAESKRESHRARAEEFASWVAFLSQPSNRQRDFSLTISDAEYFNLAATEEKP